MLLGGELFEPALVTGVAGVTVLPLEDAGALGAATPAALCMPLAAAGGLLLAGGLLAVAAVATELRPAWASSP